MAVAFEQRKPYGETLEMLFLMHHRRVLRAAYRVTGSMQDAEDVAQVVFLRLAQAGTPVPIANAESYLYRAAINAALDLLRRRDGEHAAPLDDAVSVIGQVSEPSPEQHCSSAELSAWLRQALARIGGRAAEMFVLRYLEGHDNREVARMFNTSQAVVGVMLYRTRSRLQKDFRKFMRGER